MQKQVHRSKAQRRGRRWVGMHDCLAPQPSSQNTRLLSGEIKLHSWKCGLQTVRSGEVKPRESHFRKKAHFLHPHPGCEADT